MGRTRISPIHADSDRSVDMTEKLSKYMSPEDMMEFLDQTSDGVKNHAHSLAMIKAMTCNATELTPEEFDMALEKELKKEWEKLKDKDAHQLAIIGLLDMAVDGIDPESILGDIDGKKNS